MTTTAPPSIERLNLAWLIRLRWGTMAAQFLFVVLVDLFMQVPVHRVAALGLVAAVGLSNFALRRRLDGDSRIPGWLGLVVLVADVLLFTALLAISGGASNPFSFLYVLYIAVGALILEGVAPWSVAVVAIAGYGSLYLGDIGMAAGASGHHDMHRHLYGMWFAMAATGAMIAYVVSMIRRELRRRRQTLETLRDARARRRRLASMATMAAGAAHELSTPISTIAVVSNELKSLGRRRELPEIEREAEVIRAEADRCREILSRMAADSGRHGDVDFRRVDPAELVDIVLDAFESSERIDSDIQTRQGTRINVPVEALVDGLMAVVDNAMRASEDDQGIELWATEEGSSVVFGIRDHGCGMNPEQARHAVEPFFTTREPGEGMGLGLYLVYELAEELGGRLSIESRPGEGTTVEVRIPHHEVESS